LNSGADAFERIAGGGTEAFVDAMEKGGTEIVSGAFDTAVSGTLDMAVDGTVGDGVNPVETFLVGDVGEQISAIGDAGGQLIDSSTSIFGDPGQIDFGGADEVMDFMNDPGSFDYAPAR